MTATAIIAASIGFALGWFVGRNVFARQQLRELAKITPLEVRAPQRKRDPLTPAELDLQTALRAAENKAHREHFSLPGVWPKVKK